MANSIVSYTGTDPNGSQSVMSKVTVTSAGFLSLADIKSSDTYTLRLWIKASGARTVLAYIGGSAYTISATTSWQVCKFTAQATPSSCDLYLPAGTYYIWHPKLERSSKASDYSPAPEDVDENIEDSANAATNAANAYTDGALQSYSTTAEMRSEINQTRDEINLSVTEQITQTRTYADRKAAEARTNAGTDTDTKLQSYVTTTTHTADLTVLSNQIASKVSTSTFNTLEGRVTNAESAIVQNAGNISSTVTSVNALNGRMTTAESNITQNATDISLRVIKGDRSVSGQTVNDTIAEINASTKGILLSTAGKLQITAGNFQLDAYGNATLAGGIIRSSNYVANTSGTKIDLSNGTIDTKNFKVSSTGILTATGASITGSTFRIDTTGRGGEDVDYITLRNIYEYTTMDDQPVSETFTLFERPNGVYMTDEVQSGGTLRTTASTDIFPGGIIVSGATSHVSIFGSYGINTNDLYCDNFYLNGFGIALQGVSDWASYGATVNVGRSEINLRLCGSTVYTTSDLDFTTAGRGVMLQGRYAFRLYSGEMALGVDTINMRFYAARVYFNCPAYTNTGAVVTSDLRTKENISLLDRRYLDMIKSLKPTRFNIKGIKDDHLHTGFIAQEVLSAMTQAGLKPEELAAFVDTEGDGSKYALIYDEFAALLLLYIQDLEKQIHNLKGGV